MSPRRKNILPHDSVKRKAATNEVQQTESDIADALVELYQLLNKYEPRWYERQHQRKAEAVLRRLGRL
jgi:hypothetical protein